MPLADKEKNILDWTMSKVSIGSKQIKTIQKIEDNLKFYPFQVVFVAQRSSANAMNNFLDYREVTRKLSYLDDVDFAFIDPSDFDDSSHLVGLTSSAFYRTHKFGIRVYRRGSLADDQDIILSGQPNVDDVENFIFKSTFVGKDK